LEINRQRFWDNKILGWESDKYASPKGILARVFDVNRSLKKRQQITQNVLKQIVNNNTVLEIGCGTARLLPSIIEAGAAKYIGVDISEAAIKEARIKANDLGFGNKAEFHQFDVGALQVIDADICFSLGLLDWLELEEIGKMLSQISCRYYFHSFSERRRSLQQVIHQFYVHLMYGNKTKSYVPRYYSKEQVLDIFTTRYVHPAQYFCPKISFIGFTYQLPEGVRLNHDNTKDYFDLVAHIYKRRSQRGLGKWLRQKELPTVKQFLGDSFLGDVLELGCGTGFYSHYLHDQGVNDLICVDYSLQMLERLDIPKCTKVVADIQDYRVEKRFDTIFCAGALEFLERPKAVFYNAAQMLKSDGSLIILMPRFSFFGKIYQLFHRLHGIKIQLFTWENIQNWAQKSNLEITEHKVVPFFSICVKLSLRKR